MELADRELDAFIERRIRQAEDDRRTEEAWKESVRRYNAKRHEENRAAWHGWHLEQAERHRGVLEALVRYHETQAEKYLSEGEA